jgi:ribonuclease inhibitor
MIQPQIVLVDVSGASDSMQLQELLAAGFNFPEGYGQNWNAFSDFITTLDPMPQKIVVRGLSMLALRLPLDAEQLVACFEAFHGDSDLEQVEIQID